MFDTADPAELLVEDAYQRDLSDRSIKLIQTIVENWDWRRFKPPVVALVDEGGLIIDGQHTAIAAASHPHIRRIPIMVVEAPELVTRALAFIGHNRDRLQVSPMQLHHAAVAAGDVTALAVERICAKAGVTLVRSAYGAYRWRVGDSVAVGAISGLLGRVGERRAVELLQALVAAQRAPVAANDIKAAEMLFTHADYAEQLNFLHDGGGDDLAKAITALGDTAEREAKLFAAAQCVPLWRALGVTWFKRMKKRKKT